MTELAHPRFSYRDDPNVADFPDGLPLVVYDGICRLCSGWVRFILGRDGPRTRHLFASAQSDLGRALYHHYGLSPDDPETLLVIKDGRLHTKGEAIAVVLAGLGFPWSVFARMMLLIPPTVAERGYDLLARNRYKIGGRRDTCMLPPAGTSARFIG